MIRTALIASLVAAANAGQPLASPEGLMVDLKRSPSLGVRLTNTAFTWIVPPCGTGADHAQVAYQITVSDVGGKAVWDSGKTASNARCVPGVDSEPASLVHGSRSDAQRRGA